MSRDLVFPYSLHKDLLESTNTMSIMQMVVYHTLTMVHKIVQTGKPEYITNKLEVEHGSELERALNKDGIFLISGWL